MKIKWGLDNAGELIIQYKRKYYGFTFNHPSMISEMSTLDVLEKLQLHLRSSDLKELGINQITEWQEWEMPYE